MLSQGVGYAISALGFLAAAGGKSLLVKDIAAATGIPPAYLAKIVHALGKRGVVATQRGVGGGVTLARPANDISLFDLALALQDPVVEPTCLLGGAVCSDERACPAHEFWKAQRAEIHAYLQATKVSDVAAFEADRLWKAGKEAGS
ncbi:MAG: Rrf2 family transcriptional regulator [Phycisphaerales bacterium]